MQGLGDPTRIAGGLRPRRMSPAACRYRNRDYLDQVFGGAAAFPFGRRTYEIFARSWGAITEMAERPNGVALNSRPKYVASTSLSDPMDGPALMETMGTLPLPKSIATAGALPLRT